MRILQDEIWRKTRKLLAAGRISSTLFGYTNIIQHFKEFFNMYERKKDTFWCPFWCEKRDLNPYSVNYTPLKRARLPVPPLSHKAYKVLEGIAFRNIGIILQKFANVNTFFEKSLKYSYIREALFSFSLTSSFHRRFFGKLAAAIVLTVERIDLGELAGALVSVLFLEIRVEIRNAVLF